MVLLSEVRAELNLTPAASGDDALIAKAMDVGLMYVAAQTTLSVATSGGSFEEWFNGNIWEFTLLLRANDINITSITGYDQDGVSEVVPSTTYAQLGQRTWRFIERDAELIRYKVIYTSNYGMRAINQIIAEIAIWEYLKMPNKTGSLNKTSSVIDQTNVSYKTDSDFYNEVNRRLNTVCMIGC
jgi:hypothetical protein